MKISKNINPYWREGESKDFGREAIEYAAGQDVLLDQAFVQYECLVNMAHQVMLRKQKIINPEITAKLLKGLKRIMFLDQAGKFILIKELEDVHSNVEQYLIRKYGIETGGYLRLGIARNDQVYTDTRMYMRDKILAISLELVKLIEGLNKAAEANIYTVMPGYTHLRVSQPLTFGHWLTAKAFHFLDDLSNIIKYFDIVNQCPLGIFEMAGTHLPIDRNLTGKLLGFNKPTPHSLYTADLRGELEAKLIVEFAFLALHIRRTMNEIILFTTNEFELFKIDNLYTTGGTAQPNLENPDTLEVIRANMALFLPSAVQLFMMMDVLSSGYNRDSQQTKPVLFNTIKVMAEALPVFTGIVTTLKPNKKQMEKQANLNFSIAPSVAIQLSVKGGISFREAHRVVKTMIREGFLKKSFLEMTPGIISEAAKEAIGKDLRVNETDIAEFKEAGKCVLLQDSLGGPAPQQVRKMIKAINLKTNSFSRQITDKEKRLKKAENYLLQEVNKLIMLN
ncbi:MAG: argininosuccinate lyase, argininosuccinate lyase [Candidatus Gottesmanbacteria bacterium GW2011_GWA2_43_14]|uniref:Argininosuccinate lyase n=1 Tax=Candidatus Gottesmanbacteria bacterium GW2011_GWA2_43_14 TaxID=1618443 RepID=A0A0G1DIJ5_9BACT|nr:MAG: argininosuccinate lyase, argininosuccinate lyase [Candidatus Gottesmanbacteria bacterium GW2011_GWA2_43_14]